MKKTILLFGLILSLLSSAAFAGANISLTPIFAKMDTIAIIKGHELSLQDTLGINKLFTLYQGQIGVYTKQANLRGFYTFQKNFDGEGLLPTEIAVDKDKKPIPVTAQFGLNNSRIELGIPIRISPYFIIEPMFVSEWFTPTVTITGKEFSYADNDRRNTSGVGVNVVENVSQSILLNGKYYVTSENSMFEIKAVLSNPSVYCGFGYLYKRIDTNSLKLRISGPIAEIGVAF